MGDSCSSLEDKSPKKHSWGNPSLPQCRDQVLAPKDYEGLLSIDSKLADKTAWRNCREILEKLKKNEQKT